MRNKHVASLQNEQPKNKLDFSKVFKHGFYSCLKRGGMHKKSLPFSAEKNKTAQKTLLGKIKYLIQVWTLLLIFWLCGKLQYCLNQKCSLFGRMM